MNGTSEPRSVSAPTGWAGPARGLLQWICTNNPFYVLSALLVCLGLWISFGAQVRPEQTWALMFGLAGYTLLLAVPACLLVRHGEIWQDVRTVLLLVVLMFLATSVTFDETLARNPDRGILCYVAGLVFAVTLSEAMLRAMRLVLPGWFRVSYYLMLVLFFLYPVALVPVIDDPHGEALEWALFGFSPMAGLVALTLLPAIRRGPSYVAQNGSPWCWPYYPWALFLLLGFGVAARSYLLCWSMQHVESSIPERSIFGPYFLVPFLFAVSVLVLELGLVSRHRALIRAALLLPAALVVLATIGDRPDDLYQGFRAVVTARLGGTPFYLSLVATIGFYLYAMVRRTPIAIDALSFALVALAVVRPETLNLTHLASTRAWPILLVAILQISTGLRRRDAYRCAFGAGNLIVVVLLRTNPTVDSAFRGPLALHLVLLAILILGAAFDDALGRTLRNVGAFLVMVACFKAAEASGDPPGAIPFWVLIAYPAVMAALLAVYGLLLSHPFSLVLAAIVGGAWLSVMGWKVYASVRLTILGLDYIAGGLVLLALAQGISLFKSGLLRQRDSKHARDVSDSLA